MSDSIKSPCLKRCSLNKQNICPECHRTMDEIMAWATADNETKKRILAAVEQRKGRGSKRE
ncbi:MAG: DUF1289 domain-containing protein [Alphaproteobacteria bacterium]|uniref:DUF1289 domain-containing protein n=1 Tax=Candidatus Nitrobium versatile TaxID=2884831 RepID=A0A953J3B8_9BACT|nr:DUF1289 domain-containing protein [Candidatus Nitrobium versatile]